MEKWLSGVNPVSHSLDANNVRRVVISETFKNKEVLAKIKRSGVPCKIVRKEELASLIKGVKNTQGIACELKDFKTFDLKSTLNSLKSKEKSIIVILDSLEDPHNLGAVLRIADAFSVDGIIYKKTNQVSLNEVVARVSTGAFNFVKCIEVANLNNAISTLKDHGYWIYATDGKAKDDYSKVDYANKTVIIIGSEGFGISDLTLKNSDFIIKIPMSGHVNSLNASNAAAIIISEVYKKLNY